MEKKQVKRIPFKELLWEIRDCIHNILRHRLDVMSCGFSCVLSTGLFLTGSALWANKGKEIKALFFGGIGTALAGYSIKALRKHGPQYAKEELALYIEMQRQKENCPKIKALLLGFPYVVVNRNGDLVGKNRNPKIGFVPIGRRRIPTLVAPKKIRAGARRRKSR